MTRIFEASSWSSSPMSSAMAQPSGLRCQHRVLRRQIVQNGIRSSKQLTLFEGYISRLSRSLLQAPPLSPLYHSSKSRNGQQRRHKPCAAVTTSGGTAIKGAPVTPYDAITFHQKVQRTSGPIQGVCRDNLRGTPDS
ncbi:hypothetical protein HGRIS_012450 [Hohenbuehelia grisea]|uniref:Uncharacterized protein n=1 Tax=Hohenbuehelia grisea TaxID=104357 RepID=A0ABR3ISC2_9AGAR